MNKVILKPLKCFSYLKTPLLPAEDIGKPERHFIQRAGSPHRCLGSIALQDFWSGLGKL